ncbi:hypothetical protein JRO89_XS10G0046600 [Xanthoceras sorbifolium]|uniref:Aldehyde dehydrogenase domain-containing protein n=1 Tax=Xanthoceras sorbifolium TaxID=99658 RepID=A0ABQ8HHM0_9ROSI|nr:hypothetical protein JRO89_XS10G0046600 [Xanthoceras sorbifolium]
MEIVRDIERDVEDMREYYSSGITKSASWRKSQLEKLLILLKEEQLEIFKALKKDLGKHHVEAFRDEIGTVIKSINYALQNLKAWMSSKTAKLPKIAVLSHAEVVPEPLGLVLVISSWNFPFGLSLEPLIGAIAAGNVMALKPSELAPASSAVLANAISTYLDTKAIKVIEGGPSVGQQLLQHKWDKIFFTVGRVVMSAAVKHLTPITLEMGGKCPAVLDSLTSSWDREASIKKMFGENPRETNSVARIINKQHFTRLKNLLCDPMVKDTIVYGGSMDEDNLYPPWNNYKLQLFENVYNFDYLGMLLVILGLKTKNNYV